MTLTTSEAFYNILGSNSFSGSFLASNEDDEAELCHYMSDSIVI